MLNHVQAVEKQQSFAHIKSETQIDLDRLHW